MYTPIFYRSYDALKNFLSNKNLHTIYVLDKYNKNISKVHNSFCVKKIFQKLINQFSIHNIEIIHPLKFEKHDNSVQKQFQNVGILLLK